ncbi:MAG: hypothetical protein ACC652_03240 [Acidimicrobiales bacterium]
MAAGEEQLPALLREAHEEFGVELDPEATTLLETIVVDEHETIQWFEPNEVEKLDLAHPELARLALAAARTPPGPHVDL